MMMEGSFAAELRRRSGRWMAGCLRLLDGGIGRLATSTHHQRRLMLSLVAELLNLGGIYFHLSFIKSLQGWVQGQDKLMSGRDTSTAGTR